MGCTTGARRVIVIGAGSAGCVVAARLSEHADLDVTLLEAGPDLRTADTPVAISGPSFVEAMQVPGRSWPDLVATRASGQSPQPYVRGRGMGGSSVINAMVALPGLAGDYDAWARDHGCAGWSWHDVAPWFDRTALSLHRAERREWGAVNLALAAVEPSAVDGVPLTRSPIGRRVSVNDAYLEPARQRANLTVLADCTVERVLVEGRRVAGVRLSNGDELEADVVVVSAGAIHSPAILLRSGLDTPGIGENLQDHPSFPIAIDLDEEPRPGTLPVATCARLPGGDGTPDVVQLLPIDAGDPDTPRQGMVLAALMRTHSRGCVTVAAGDPAATPVVDLAMLSDERDEAGLSAAIDAAERVLATRPFAALGDVMAYDRSPEGMRAALGGYVHAAGTCAMGTVVDTDCHLAGYEGVVVCDASVMPVVPRAGTHLPAVMIAERVAARLSAWLLAAS